MKKRAVDIEHNSYYNIIMHEKQKFTTTFCNLISQSQVTKYA